MRHLRIELHPTAIEETRDARAWYAERSGTAADAFMAEIDTAIDRIQETPRRWATYLHGTKALSLAPVSLPRRLS